MPRSVASATHQPASAPEHGVPWCTTTSSPSGAPDGELVVVHHGTPCSGALAGWWVADATDRGIRLVGYDRRGYGESSRQPGRTVADAAADTAAIADAL